jgi:hypothetical protein
MALLLTYWEVCANQAGQMNQVATYINIDFKFACKRS